ncbi:MAG: transposase [Edaphobacter sp.]
MPLPAPQELRTYFVTAVTANRRRLFQVESNANILLETLTHYRTQNRYQLHAFVIMPDHLHAIITPSPEVSLEKAMQFIKGGFSFRLKSKLDVWSRSFNESQILTLEKFEACKSYIEQNPVRAGLAPSPEMYNHGSAKKLDVIDPRPSHKGTSPFAQRRELTSPFAQRRETHEPIRSKT